MLLQGIKYAFQLYTSPLRQYPLHSSLSLRNVHDGDNLDPVKRQALFSSQPCTLAANF